MSELLIAPLLHGEPPTPSTRPRVGGPASLIEPAGPASASCAVVRQPLGAAAQELSSGNGLPCWRGLGDERTASVWNALHRGLLDRFGKAGRIDGQRALVAPSSIPATQGQATGPNSTACGTAGTEHHVITEGHGLPPAVRVAGANWHEWAVFVDLVDAVPPIRDPSGRPRMRPTKLHAGTQCAIPRCWHFPHRREIPVRIARIGNEPTGGLGHHRRGSTAPVPGCDPSDSWPSTTRSGSAPDSGATLRTRYRERGGAPSCQREASAHRREPLQACSAVGPGFMTKHLSGLTRSATCCPSSTRVCVSRFGSSMVSISPVRSPTVYRRAEPK